MKVTAIKTRKFLPPKDDLFSLIKESFFDLKLKEKSVFVVTSKIVSIWQGRCEKIQNPNSKIQKDELIKKESEVYIDRKDVPKQIVIITIANNILIPSAGIDESNANGYYILWPKKPFLSAKEIYNFIKKTYKLQKFGVIISDSHTTPMRSGIMGMGLSYWGFNPLRDYRGKKDIYGRELKMSQTNIVDSLAAAAVFEMGEGAEQTPIAIIEDVDVEFDNVDYTKNNPLEIKKEIDIYYPLIKNAPWKKGRGKK